MEDVEYIIDNAPQIIALASGGIIIAGAMFIALITTDWATGIVGTAIGVALITWATLGDRIKLPFGLPR